MSQPTASPRHAAGTRTPDQPPSWAPAASTITLLTAIGVLMVGQMYTVLALLHPMTTSLGTTSGQATWTATAFGFAYAAGFLLAGPLSDRYGSRAVITAGLVAATAATLAVSAAPDLTWAIALRTEEHVHAVEAQNHLRRGHRAAGPPHRAGAHQRPERGAVRNRPRAAPGRLEQPRTGAAYIR
ncbi:MFS transporter [Streptomyces sp. cf124]|uniref:MFS transporter n=1 Tax=Streptomyces sp. cf124 TaxID=1761903 RepID=UPI000AF82E45|nr:MFS transporter [Streptomyces sp. cf124]